ncbi:MAG TPA: cupin domain-containing protein [Pyrinomonadaceae bacterium]
MRTIRIITLAALIGLDVLSLYVARAQQPTKGRAEGAAVPTAGSTADARYRETTTVVADEPITNLPGKRLVSRLVEYPPGGGTAPHRHAPSAFIYAYVLSGEIRSQIDDGPARVYRAGETWFENPGAHHRVSVNASDTKPARLLAVLVVDEADKQMTIPDPR